MCAFRYGDALASTRPARSGATSLRPSGGSWGPQADAPTSATSISAFPGPIGGVRSISGRHRPRAIVASAADAAARRSLPAHGGVGRDVRGQDDATEPCEAVGGVLDLDVDGRKAAAGDVRGPDAARFVGGTAQAVAGQIAAPGNSGGGDRRPFRPPPP